VKRLVFHGEANVVRFTPTADGGLDVDIFQRDGLSGVTLEPAERAELARELAKPVKRKAGKKLARNARLQGQT
jgi:hypothetical protein